MLPDSFSPPTQKKKMSLARETKLLQLLKFALLLICFVGNSRRYKNRYMVVASWLISIDT